MYEDPYPYLPLALIGNGETTSTWVSKANTAIALAHQAYGRREPILYDIPPFPDPSVEILAIAVLEKNPSHRKVHLDPEMILSIIGSSEASTKKIPWALIRRNQVVYAHTQSGDDDLLPAFVRVTSEASAVIGMAFTVQKLPYVIFLATENDLYGKKAAAAFRQSRILDGFST